MIVILIHKIMKLQDKCLNLEKYFKHDNLLDLGGLDLFSELNILKETIGLENDNQLTFLII